MWLIENDSRFHTWGFFELLVDRSREDSFTNVGRAEELAELALQLADKLDASRYGAERIEDLRARAWGAIGNACRVRSDLAAAETAFEAAFVHLRQGTRDGLERACLLDLRASLLRAQRRLDEAVRLLRRAVQIFSDVGDRHRAGRSLVNLSTVHHIAGETERSIPLLVRAQELIDPAREPRLLLCARYDMIAYLAGLGRHMEARGLYAQSRHLFRQFPDPWAQNRRQWIKGKIARGLGQADEAETALRAARDGFLAEGIAYNVALVSLDLAALYAEQGRTGEMKRLAAEMMPIFSSRQIHREALVALAFFRRAVEEEEASLRLVQTVASYLERAQHDPQMSFEKPSQP